MLFDIVISPLFSSAFFSNCFVFRLVFEFALFRSALDFIFDFDLLRCVPIYFDSFPIVARAEPFNSLYPPIIYQSKQLPKAGRRRTRTRKKGGG